MYFPRAKKGSLHFVDIWKGERRLVVYRLKFAWPSNTPKSKGGCKIHPCVSSGITNTNLGFQSIKSMFIQENVAESQTHYCSESQYPPPIDLGVGPETPDRQHLPVRPWAALTGPPQALLLLRQRTWPIAELYPVWGQQREKVYWKSWLSLALFTVSICHSDWCADSTLLRRRTKEVVFATAKEVPCTRQGHPLALTSLWGSADTTSSTMPRTVAKLVQEKCARRPLYKLTRMRTKKWSAEWPVWMPKRPSGNA